MVLVLLDQPIVVHEVRVYHVAVLRVILKERVLYLLGAGACLDLVVLIAYLGTLDRPLSRLEGVQVLHRALVLGRRPVSPLADAVGHLATRSSHDPAHLSRL